MSYYTERDYLLPKDKPAPEILGSRPQSINDIGVTETEALDNDDGPRPRSINDWMAIVFGLCVFVSLVFVLSPHGFLDAILGDRRPVPHTVEQRVDRILMDTPLIGTSPNLLNTTAILTFGRRTQ